MFQSQAGFVPLCDLSPTHIANIFFLFQSQAGFVPLCDLVDTHRAKAGVEVSIPGGICSSLRHDQIAFLDLPVLVSIPGGICSSLRPLSTRDRVWLRFGFNPRRDLFLFATSNPSSPLSMMISVSIPGGICSSLRRRSSPTGRRAGRRFNPRRDLFLFATSLKKMSGIQ